MAKNGLGITMINMYCGMVDEEFAPVIAMLESRTAGIKSAVMRQVKKDLGVYDLIMQKTALEEKVKEIEQQIRSKTKQRIVSGPDGRSDWQSPIEAETDRRLAELNRPLTEAIAAKESLKKSIKLSTASSQISGLFEVVSGEVARRLQTAAALPPIDVPLIEEAEDEDCD